MHSKFNPISLLSDNFIKTHPLENTSFIIKEIDAIKLLKPERIDLAAKLIYIEAVVTGKEISYAREVYSKHLEAFSEGSYSEPGDENKTTLEDYYLTFDKMIHDFQKSGFNSNKSIIPVGENSIILDGSHRTACAIFFRQKVKIIKFSEYTVNFNYQYFRSRFLSEEILREMTLCYLRYVNSNFYCACLWPIIDNPEKGAEIILSNSNPLYKTSVALTRSGIRNLMLQIYCSQDWIGTTDNNFDGVWGKVNDCYKPGNSCTIIIFEGNSLDTTLQLKENVRNAYKIGKHAIHISDTNAETWIMASLLLNNNSIQALNYANLNFQSQINSLIGFNYTHLGEVFSYEATLSYYCDFNFDTIPSSNTSAVLNIRKYFSYFGAYIPSLPEAKKMLEISTTPEKKKYLNAINSVIHDYALQNIALKRKLNYLKIKVIWCTKKYKLLFKRFLAYHAKKMGVYDILHKIHQAIKRK